MGALFDADASDHSEQCLRLKMGNFPLSERRRSSLRGKASATVIGGFTICIIIQSPLQPSWNTCHHLVFFHSFLPHFCSKIANRCHPCHLVVTDNPLIIK